MTDLSGNRGSGGTVPCSVRTAAYIVGAYGLSHGCTAFLCTPLQERFLPDVTLFASLMYLPHGVRVLAAWLCGWRAVLPLFIGSIIADIVFTPVEVREVLQPMILQSWIVGAVCAPLAFDVLRRFSGHTYPRTMNWRWLLVAGMLASVINSLGQTFVFSGLMDFGQMPKVVVLYALGDVIGLAVSTLCLMVTFRWMRLGFGR